MNKKLIYICIFISFLCSGNIIFSETQLGLSAFTVSNDSELVVTSDSMVFNSETKYTEFIDNVIVKYGDIKLEASLLKIEQNSDPSINKYLEFFLDGPLIISNMENFIYGDKAFYSRKNQELTISGNVNLVQGGNRISGEKLILNLDNGLAKISGSVQTILEPLGTNSNE